MPQSSNPSHKRTTMLLSEAKITNDDLVRITAQKHDDRASRVVITWPGGHTTVLLLHQFQRLPRPSRLRLRKRPQSWLRCGGTG